MEEGKKHSWKTEGHYTKDGKEWKGLQHAHDGQVMTGAEHTDDSQNLYHFKELSPDVQKKVLARMKLKEDLRKWFGKGKKGDWVRVGTDGEIKGDCAREPGEGKPKCMPRSKAHSMSKDDRASAARRKRRADPEVDRPGTGNTPIMVKTDKEKKKVNEVKTIKVGEDAVGSDKCHYALVMHRKVTAVGTKDEMLAKCAEEGGRVWVSTKQVGDIVESEQLDELSPNTVHKYIEKRTMGGKTQYTYQKKARDARKAGDETESEKNRAKAKKIGQGINRAVARHHATRRGDDTMSHKSVAGKVPQAYRDRAKHGPTKSPYKSVGESVELVEKNVPTNPALWAKFKAQAKAKFDVYPSAYANGWAAKQYKKAGGGWKTVKEDFDQVEEGATKSYNKYKKRMHQATQSATKVKPMGSTQLTRAAAVKMTRAAMKKEEVDQIDEKSDYQIYHKDFTSAVQHAIKQAEKKGYKVDMDDWWNKVSTGPRKPSAGKTNSYQINLLDKSGKPIRNKRLNMQVYNMDNKGYELNMYTESVDLDEAKYSVDVEGLPRFYMDGDSPGKVKVAVRKLLKKVDLLKDVERVNDAKIKKDLRLRLSGKSDIEGQSGEEIDEASLRMKIAARGKVETQLKKMKNDDAEMAAFLVNQGDLKELQKFLKTADKKVVKVASQVFEASKVPAGMKFISSYVYKGGDGKDHSHTYYRKGTKMTDPIVVHIDDKEWETFNGMPKAKKSALDYIKNMKEEVEQIDEAKPEFEVKYAKSKNSPIKVTKFMSLEDAKEFLKTVRADGMNGMIVKRGKPVKEEVEQFDESWKEIETYAKKHGGIDKNDMLKVAAMLKRGDKKGALKFAKTLDTDPRDWLLGKMNEEVELDEKAVSKAQQRFMGMVHAVKSGKLKAPSKEVADAAKSMSKKDAKDYAETKHKGLPEKK